MIFRVSGNVTDPHKPIILDLGYTKLLKLIPRKTKYVMVNLFLVKFRISKTENVEKRARQEMFGTRLVNSW